MRCDVTLSPRDDDESTRATRALKSTREHPSPGCDSRIAGGAAGMERELEVELELEQGRAVGGRLRCAEPSRRERMG